MADLNKRFEDWGHEEAKAAVDEVIYGSFGPDGIRRRRAPELAGGLLAPGLDIAETGLEAYEDTKALVEYGDHWQNGAYVPYTGDPALRSKDLSALMSEQAPVDALNEAIDNGTNGLCGTEPALTFPLRNAVEVENPEDEAEQASVQKRIREANKRARLMYQAIAERWDETGLWDIFRVVARRAQAYGVGPVRAWITSEGLVEQNGVKGIPVGQLTFKEALARIVLAPTLPENCAVYVQPSTQRKIGIFLYERVVQVKGRTEPQKSKAAELWYVEGFGETAMTVRRDVFDTAGENGQKTQVMSRLPLGGQLPIASATARKIATPSVRLQQHQLDFIGISGSVAIKQAGFRARWITNAKPFGVWSATPPTDGPPLEEYVGADGKKWYLIETNMYVGPGVSIALQGETLEDTVSDGDTGQVTTRRTMSNPNVILENPVDPDFFIKAAEYRRLSILREAKQGHLALNKNAESSGVAYVQARGAFEQSLNNSAGPLERTGVGILTYIIALADYMTKPSDPLKGFLKDHNVSLIAHVDPGPLTPDEQRIIIEKWKDGVMSFEDMLGELGVENVAAAMDSMRRDPLSQVRQITIFAEMLLAVKNATGVIEAGLRALKEAGVDDRIIKALTPAPTDTKAADSATPTSKPVDPSKTDDKSPARNGASNDNPPNKANRETEA